MYISIFIKLPRVNFAVENQAISSAVKIHLTQLLSLTPWFLFDFGQAILDASHDAYVERICTIGYWSNKSPGFSSVFSDVEFDRGGFQIFLAGGLSCWTTWMLEM